MIAVRSLAVYAVLACCGASSAASAAQTAAPSPSGPQSAIQAAVPTDGSTLGRFFFTPAQRAALDAARGRPAPVTAQTAKPMPPAPEYVTLNGVVRRSDGATTVWLNNKPVRGGQSEDGLQIAPATRSATAGNVTVRVPQTGRVVNLKVGQQVDVTTGQIVEGYRTPRPTEPAADAATSRGEAGELADARIPRRPNNRERQLLRELLREIDTEGPAASAAEPPRSTAAPTPVPAGR